MRDDELVVFREKTQEILVSTQDLIQALDSLQKQIANIHGVRGQRLSLESITPLTESNDSLLESVTLLLKSITELVALLRDATQNRPGIGFRQ